MGKTEILTILGKDRTVEHIVENIARSSLTPDLKDLCQMVYQILMELPEEKVLGLWKRGQMRFFIARLVMNQYRSSSSPFYITYRKYAKMAVELDEEGTDAG